MTGEDNPRLPSLSLLSGKEELFCTDCGDRRHDAGIETCAICSETAANCGRCGRLIAQGATTCRTCQIRENGREIDPARQVESLIRVKEQMEMMLASLNRELGVTP